MSATLSQGRAHPPIEYRRWITLVLLFLGMVAVVPVFRDPEAFRMPKLPGTLGVLALFVTYGLIGRGLLYSDSVRAFFRASKRSAEQEGEPDVSVPTIISS